MDLSTARALPGTLRLWSLPIINRSSRDSLWQRRAPYSIARSIDFRLSRDLVMNGIRTVRMQQVYRGVPVYMKDYTVTLDESSDAIRLVFDGHAWRPASS